MNQELEIDLILDNYLDNEINKTKAVDLLKVQGVENPELELEIHISAANLLRTHNNILQVESIHSQYTAQQQNEVESNKSGKVVGFNLKWLLRIAAVFILGGGLWFVNDYRNANTEGVYVSLYQDYAVNTDRATGQPVESPIVQAFKNKDFNGVLTLATAIENLSNRELFLTGYANIQLKKYQEAEGLLKTILENNKSVAAKFYNDDAEYYLGLCLIKLNKVNEAEAIFKMIYKTSSHTYNEKVKSKTLRHLKWL